MSLTADQLGEVIRLQGVAEEVLLSARAARNHEQIGGVGEQLRAVIREVARTVEGTPLADEFARIIPDEEQIHWSYVDPRASVLLGWLRGAVQAESLQMRIDAEARAYAEARIRAERPIGFER